MSREYKGQSTNSAPDWDICLYLLLFFSFSLLHAILLLLFLYCYFFFFFLHFFPALFISLSYHHVLLGDNSTQTAVDLLSDTAKGRGATIPYHMLNQDVNRWGVKFLFPIKEYTAPSLALFVHFMGKKKKENNTNITTSSSSSCDVGSGISTPIHIPTFRVGKKAAQAAAHGINALTHGEFIYEINSERWGEKWIYIFQFFFYCLSQVFVFFFLFFCMFHSLSSFFIYVIYI